MKILLLFLISLGLFFLLDTLWFRVAGDFFKGEIGSLITTNQDGSWKVRYVPAVLAYICMALAMTYFVSLHSISLSQAALSGAILGLVTFGIYDMTNLALLSGWTIRFVLVDITWGILTNTFVAMFVFLCKRWFW